MSKKNEIKLTTRGRYAVMALVDLAQNAAGRPVPLSDLAERGNISLSYLEQLFAGLRRGGLVISHRGPGGGYRLSRAAKDILIADIMNAAEDCAPARRVSGTSPANDVHLPTHALWSHIGALLYASLREVSLEDVLQDRIAKQAHATQSIERKEG